MGGFAVRQPAAGTPRNLMPEIPETPKPGDFAIYIPIINEKRQKICFLIHTHI